MSTETKIVYYPAPGKVYSPEEIAEAFSALNVNDTVPAVLRQILQQRLAGATVEVGSRDLTPEQRAHAAGRLSELMNISHEIFEHMERPKAGRKRRG